MNKKGLRKIIYASSLALLELSLVTATKPAQAATNTEPKAAIVAKHNTEEPMSVNDYLLGLDYDSQAVLTRQGDMLTNHFAHETTTDNNGRFVVVEKQKKTISNSTSSISVTTANDSRVFAGALFKADNNLIENNPTLVSLRRAPITVSVDLPGMTDNTNAKLVAHPTTSSVNSAVNDLVEKWIAKDSVNHAIPARIEYDTTSAQSMDQLKVKFGADFAKISVPLKIDFDAIHNGEKQASIVNFKQIYYTASVDAPENPGDVFDAHVTAKDLQKRGINSKTPLVYVSSVSYGRSMYIKLETTSKSDKVQAAFDAAIKGVKIAPNSDYDHILKNTSVVAVILGGNSGDATEVVRGDINTLKELIQKGSKFDSSNPGVAVSYGTSFLKDNQVAVINNTADYIATKVTEYSNGKLILNHKGAYVARFFVDWDEVSYDSNGREVLTHHTWADNGRGRTSGFSTEINLKGNVRHLNVKIQECTGLAWEWWRTIYDEQDLPLAHLRQITIWGTTLRPKHKEEVKND